MLDAALRMFTDFAYVCVWILRTLCGFCVRIRLIFTIFNADSLEGSDPEGSVNLFCPHELLVIIGQSQGSDIEGSVDFFFPRELLVINHPNYLEVYLLVLIEQYFPVE